MFKRCKHTYVFTRKVSGDEKNFRKECEFTCKKCGDIVYKDDPLRPLLREIALADSDYDNRYQLVLDAMALANRMGLAAGWRIDPDEPEWPVAFIELPYGKQVSWHMPQHKREWDGHSTEEKLSRLRKY